jgi:hypothetical protein
VPARVNADHDESDTRGHGAQRTLLARGIATACAPIARRRRA